MFFLNKNTLLVYIDLGSMPLLKTKQRWIQILFYAEARKNFLANKTFIKGWYTKRFL